MLKTIFDMEQELVHLELGEEIDATDLKSTAEVIRHYLSDGHKLVSLMISVEKYSHWAEFGKLLVNLDVDEYFEKNISQLAIVCDTPTLDIGKYLAELFSCADIHIYSYCEYDKAVDWLISTNHEEDTSKSSNLSV